MRRNGRGFSPVSGTIIVAAFAANMSLLSAPAQADEKLFDELRFGASASIQGGHERENGFFSRDDGILRPVWSQRRH